MHFGVSTFKKFLLDLAGRYIYFVQDSKNVFYLRLDTPSLRPLRTTSACFDEQPSWADLVRRNGVSNFEKIYIFLASSWKIVQHMYRPSKSMMQRAPLQMHITWIFNMRMRYYISWLENLTCIVRLILLSVISIYRIT